MRNKKCNNCEVNMDKIKRRHKPTYWVYYRLPSGRTSYETAGKDFEAAKALDLERKRQKKTNSLVEYNNSTFDEIKNWYLNLQIVKKVKTFKRIEQCIRNFCDVFGGRKISTIKKIDLMEYQLKRQEDGRALATIDMELKYAQTMINLAFENDIIDGVGSLKAFRSTKRLQPKGANARQRILAIHEYVQIVNVAPSSLRPLVVTAMNTGMRLGEIRKLKWEYVEGDFLRLPGGITKEKKDKSIPVNHNVRSLLSGCQKYKEHDFIFTVKDRPLLGRNGLRKSWNTACKNAGLIPGRSHAMGITFHDIRRSVKTYMTDAGVDPVHRDMILGHSLQGMDVHYNIRTDSALESAMGKYTTWLDKKYREAELTLGKNTDCLSRC
ncbi:MAG: site-specific integrase [Desulfobacteraceae bacterium]|nr:site-specific integrase [Desulfobacteraceae bacterium]